MNVLSEKKIAEICRDKREKCLATEIDSFLLSFPDFWRHYSIDCLTTGANLS